MGKGEDRCGMWIFMVAESLSVAHAVSRGVGPSDAGFGPVLTLGHDLLANFISC